MDSNPRYHFSLCPSFLHPGHCYPVLVFELECRNDRKSYAGCTGTPFAGRFNHVGLVAGKKPDRKLPLALQVGGLSVWLITTSQKRHYRNPLNSALFLCCHWGRPLRLVCFLPSISSCWTSWVTRRSLNSISFNACLSCDVLISCVMSKIN